MEARQEHILQSGGLPWPGDERSQALPRDEFHPGPQPVHAYIVTTPDGCQAGFFFMLALR